MQIENLRLHKILFQLAKTWNFSPLLILVKNEYLFVHSKLMDRIIPLVMNNQENRVDSRQELVKKVGKLGKFKIREEITEIIQVVLNKLEKN